MRFTEIHLQPMLGSLICILLLNSCLLNGHNEPIKSPSVSVATADAQGDMSTRPASAWQPASYRGLIMGQSTYQDMVDILGPPKGTYPDRVDGIVSYTYNEIADFPGTLTVIVDQRSGKIMGVSINPKRLSKDRATAYFGNGFVTTKYAFDNCKDEPKSDQLYESPNGVFTYLEYRERGIALLVSLDGNIGGISYVSKPIGKVKRSCK